ncbi:MAG: hypothetical protein RJB66_484 [Pseudomonadota bacterium]|jgi:hypothetical protein
MSFEKAMNKMKFDIRLLEYNLSQGFITKEDYNKFLAQLEDSANLVAPPEVEAEEVEELEESEEESH